MKRNLVPWWRSGAAVLFAAGVAIGVLATAPVHAQKTQLNVYTALETDQIKAYETAFNKTYPDIELKWTRDSTGVITAKVLAEKANPQADIVIGTSASSLAVFANEGMLEPYAPKGLDKIPAVYRDKQNPPRWVGMDVYGAAICFNTVEAQKQGLPKPSSWKDLTKPVYKGKVVMPNPASSGTGSLTCRDGCRCGARTTRGSTWTRSRQHRRLHALRFAALQAGGRRGVPDRRIVRVPRDGDEEVRRAGRYRFPERRSRLGSRGERHHQGHEESGRREEADGLARDAGGDGAVREQLRGRRDAGHVEAARVHPDRLREAPHQERLRLVGEEP